MSAEREIVPYTSTNVCRGERHAILTHNQLPSLPRTNKNVCVGGYQLPRSIAERHLGCSSKFKFKFKDSPLFSLLL